MLVVSWGDGDDWVMSLVDYPRFIHTAAVTEFPRTTREELMFMCFTIYSCIILFNANHVVKVTFKDSRNSFYLFGGRIFKVTLQRCKNIVIGRFMFIFTIYYS